MKQIAIITLTILALSCSGQEPDTLAYYNIEYVDSLKNDYEQRIVNLQSIIDTYSSDEISVIADTFNFEIVDDRIKIEVNKLGHDCHVEIIDGEKRIDAYYVNYERIVNLTE